MYSADHMHCESSHATEPDRGKCPTIQQVRNDAGEAGWSFLRKSLAVKILVKDAA